jgi:hypothetical protein
MDNPRQQVESGGPTAKEVLPNEHKTRSKGLAIATLIVICLSGFLFIFLVQ